MLRTFAQVSVCAMTLMFLSWPRQAKSDSPVRMRTGIGTSRSFSQLAFNQLFPQHFATEPNLGVKCYPMTPHNVGHGRELRILQPEIPQGICRIAIRSSAKLKIAQLSQSPACLRQRNLLE